MLLSEFENLTDIYPDVNLYRAIEHEYNEGDWESKAQFCNAYKFNEDGLATRLRAAANQRLIDMEEQHRRAVNTAQRLREENAKLTARIEELEHKCQDFTTLETAQPTDLTDLEATMLQALRDMADDEFQRDEIGTALIGYDYLLKRLEVATI